MQPSTHSGRRPARRHPRRTALLLATGAFAALVAAALMWPTATRPDRAGEPDAPAAAAVAAAAAAAPAPTADPIERRPADVPSTAPRRADRDVPAFVVLVEELTALGIATARHVQDDDTAAAAASDQQARETVELLLAHYLDAGERTLAMMAEQAGEPGADEHRQARRHVLRLLLGIDLERRRAYQAAAATAAAGATATPGATAASPLGDLGDLVQMTLDTLPLAEECARDGAGALIDRPYLAARHEPTILDLVRLAGEGHFPRDLATGLLGTLWTNLKASGERTSEELTQLALLLLGDTDASKRAVACRQLLTNARYRPMLLAWLRDHDDRAAATEVANLAAKDLPATEALAVLRELGAVLPRPCSAYLLLAHRDPDAVADAYRELLAADTQPDQRQDLVTSFAVTAGEHGTAIPLLALQSDPSPEVRLQAVFAISTGQDHDLTERAFDMALDDPQIAGNVRRLGSLVFALQNLEAAGQTNAVDRIGNRMRTMALDEASRQRLETLLARSLPGGSTGGIGAR